MEDYYKKTAFLKQQIKDIFKEITNENVISFEGYKQSRNNLKTLNELIKETK